MFTSPSDKFEKLNKAFFEDCINGSCQLRILMRLLKLPEQYPELYLEGSEFFDLSVTSYIDSSFNRVCKFFDTSSSGTNIFKYLNYIEKQIHLIFPTKNEQERERILIDLRSDRDILNGFIIQIKYLKNLRDKCFAHLSNESIADRNKIFEDNPISFEDLNKIYIQVAEIMNRYLVHYSGTVQAIEFIDEMMIDPFFEVVDELIVKHNIERRRGLN